MNGSFVKSRLALAILVSTMLGCAFGANAAHAKIWLVKDGKAHAEIVISDTPERAAKLAARELQETLAKMTGAQVEIVTTPGADVPAHIYVGRSDWTDKLGIDGGTLEKDMYRVLSGDNWLALIGNDEEFKPSEPWCKSREDRPRMQADWEKRTGKTWRAFDLTTFKAYNKELDIWSRDGAGSLYAVYDFLRSLGVEWYMPGEIGEVIPQTASIELPTVNMTVKPETGYRGITFVNFFDWQPGVSDDVLWYFRLGLGALMQGFGHSMQVILSDTNNYARHPEYYALYNGKRDFLSRGGKPCLSSEGLLQEMVAYARACFDIYPEMDAFPVMPTDGFGNMCQCDLCRGKGAPERGGAGYLSDYVWGFVNRVAGEIEKSHPGKMIGCCAYSTYLLPPEKVNLHTNVIVQICRWRQNDARGPERRAKALEIRNAWKAKLAPGRLYTWDYYLNNRATNNVPIFFPHVIQADLKSWKGDLQGEFIESGKDSRGKMNLPGLSHLNAYITARLYWDSDQDLDEMLDDYYRLFFGPARKEMKQFCERAENNWMHYKAADFEYLLTALDKAAKKAGPDTVYGKRIALIRAECEASLRQSLQQARDKKEYARVEIDKIPAAAITLDGRMDEASWKASPEFALKDCVTSNDPKNPTRFRVACDGNHLYIGVVCQEPEMQTIRAVGASEDDMNIWLDDAIEVILKTPEHSYYQFAVNPNGALLDADRSQDLDTAWDSGATAASAKDAESWTLEIRIPLEGIEGETPSADQPWSLNIGRNRQREEASEVTIFVPAGPPRATFHNLGKMATLIVK